MALRDVLLALGAGAGRQAEIGGLMFQDAQKREARDYEYALEKEKWRRSGDLSALKNAREAHKANWDAYLKDYDRVADQYWRAKSGYGDEGMDWSQVDLTPLKTEMDRLWQLSQKSKSEYFKYSGIDYIWEDQPDVGTELTKKEASDLSDALVSSVISGVSQTQLLAYHESVEKGEQVGGGSDLTIKGMVEQANKILRDQFRLEQRELGNENISEEDVIAAADMKGQVLAAFKKKARAKLKSLAKNADIEFDTGRFREAANPESVRGQMESDESQKIFAANKALQGTGIDVQDMYIPDPATQGFAEKKDFVKEAEARAAERAQQINERGLISESAYSRAYTEAQQALTQLMVQTGALTQEQFMALVLQREIKGVELQAYQRAFRDITMGQ